MQVYKTTGVKPALLAEQPDLPDTVSYLVEWYVELRGPEPLSYSEIKNWSELMCRCVRSWEVEVLKRLDRMFWESLTK